MVARQKELDGFRMGPFTKDEEATLRKAIDEHIGEHYSGDRNAAVRLLLAKRGREPSQLVTIGRAVLPHRHPKSVYNFARRRIVQYKAGKWTPEELYVLLNHYFKREFEQRAQPGGSEGVAVPGPPVASGRSSWRSVAQQVNRLPEQIYDKWKEVRPDLGSYRALFAAAHLSREERIARIAQRAGASSSSLPAVESSTGGSGGAPGAPDGAEATSSERPSSERPSSSSAVQRSVHEYILSLAADGTIAAPVVANIPWTRVRAHFPHFSESKLRLCWTLVTFPEVMQHHVRGFSKLVVGRCGVYVLRRRRVVLDRLSHADFGAWFPQLPPLFVAKCVDGVLKTTVARFRDGALRHCRVDVAAHALLAPGEGAPRRAPGASHEDRVEGYESDAYGSVAGTHDPHAANRGARKVHRRRRDNEVVRVEGGHVSVSLYRQIKLAYHEFQAARHHEADMRVLGRIPHLQLPPFPAQGH